MNGNNVTGTAKYASQQIGSLQGAGAEVPTEQGRIDKMESALNHLASVACRLDDYLASLAGEVRPKQDSAPTCKPNFLTMLNSSPEVIHTLAANIDNNVDKLQNMLRP